MSSENVANRARLTGRRMVREARIVDPESDEEEQIVEIAARYLIKLSKEGRRISDHCSKKTLKLFKQY